MAERPGKFGEALGPTENAVMQSRVSGGRRGRSRRVAVVQTIGGGANLESRKYKGRGAR